ncbi:MAG TPA: YiiX/YebB-like N1pC/P60 family cysteine hydrolase [Mesorhizobium sp.]|jgi:hypothetical protein
MKALFLAMLLSLGVSTEPYAEEVLWDKWKMGDLIVQETTGRSADALRAAGSHFTHIGIVRPTGGGPYVMEMTEDGFGELPVEDFIARGVGHRYAVFRYPGLTEKQGFKVMMAAFESEHAPYDPFFRLDAEAVYPAELVYRTFQKTGITLAEPSSVTKAKLASAAGQKLLLDNWRKNPDCRNKTREQCWKAQQSKSIVTPAEMVANPKLKMVHSTFD